MQKSRRKFIAESAAIVTSSVLAPCLSVTEANGQVSQGDLFEKGIRLVVTLFENPNFEGAKREIVVNTPNLSDQDFNDKTSSVIVQPGPNHPNIENLPATHPLKEPTVTLFEHQGFTGGSISLTQGKYPNLARPFNFDDVVTSVAFDFEPEIVQPIRFIPFVVELYENPNFGGSHIVVAQNTPDLGKFGPRFNKVSSIKIFQGPDFEKLSLKMVTFFSEINFEGDVVLERGPGVYADLGVFDDRIRSLSFVFNEPLIANPTP